MIWIGAYFGAGLTLAGFVAFTRHASRFGNTISDSAATGLYLGITLFWPIFIVLVAADEIIEYIETAGKNYFERKKK